MEYRTTKPEDNDFDNEDDELDAMRDFVQGVMENSAATDMLDAILIWSNICEHRASLSMSPKVSDWYRRFGIMLRASLEEASEHSKDTPKPNEKLENPYLYFPHVEQTH